MRPLLFVAILLLAPLALAAPAAAQDHAGEDHDAMMQHHPPVLPDLLRDVATVREKLEGLAEAIPEEAYDWRPGEGVRSVSEVFMHVAADNYLLPTAAGVEPPASTGLVGNDYATVQAFQDREVTKAQAMEHLSASFDHLTAAMEGASDASMGEEVSIFNMELTAQALWIMATTHLHEHLGQMIAYARTNGVVPPWSR